MENKTKDAIKQLQGEMRQLHALVTARLSDSREDTSTPEGAAGGRKGRDAVVQYTVLHTIPGGGVEPKKVTLNASAAQLARVTNESGAAVGYALASPQKIALLRALLDKEFESAAVLGEVTHLSTGSLYHHLRELMRANLIHQSSRNQYQLTERGTRVLLVLLALASEMSSSQER